ncbi:hypothetical protein [Escherichia coli IS25]|nr:hypothetical protein [Escherichia coli IS25]
MVRTALPPKRLTAGPRINKKILFSLYISDFVQSAFCQ